METKLNKTKTISINRTFNLPVSAVWKAWTDPETCKKWWGPKNYTCPGCTIDLKVGGKYFSSMKDKKDGKITYGIGTYKEIVPNKKLVLTDSFANSKGEPITAAEAGMPGEWPMESLITVEFKENDGKTDFSLKHEGLPSEIYDDCIDGWQQSFDKLEENINT